MVGLSSFLVPQEGIRHEEQNTTLYINNREVGKGTLYITESVFTWVNGDTGKGISIEYPNIALHAVSRDTTVYSKECLYIMVDSKVDFQDESIAPPSAPESNDEDSFEETATELRFSPDNISSLDAMFVAMNECQALHPDPEQQSLSDGEDIYEDAEEDEGPENNQETGGDSSYILSSEQAETSSNGNTADEVMDVEAGQFEDAEENP